MSGGVHVKRLMRALAVERLTETITRELLSAPSARWGACGFCFQRMVHALMAAMLLGFAGLDEFGEDPQADPPGGEL
jgi:hypothetical protein